MLFHKKIQKSYQIDFYTFCEKINSHPIEIFNCLFYSKIIDDNSLMLTPKSISVVSYNSFMPCVRLTKKEGYIEIEYFLRKLIFIPFLLLISLNQLLGITIFIFSNADDRFLISGLLVFIGLLLVAVATIIFYLTVKHIEKILSNFFE